MPNEKITVKGVWDVIKKTVKSFLDDNVMMLCGSLSYATIFSLAPFVVVLLSIITLFFGKEAIEGEVFGKLENYMGADAALQIQNLVKNASLSGKSTIAAIIGGATLLFGATAVFSQIQNSLNTIWGIKPKPKKGWLKMIINRLLSFSLIITMGFLLIVSFLLNTALDILSESMIARYESIGGWLFVLLNHIITFLLLTILIGGIFKFLPDAKIRLKDVLIGAMVTSILFMIGKIGISLYIRFSNFENTFGSAATIIIILVWIYYSSLILYFGAEFTKVWAVKYGFKIYPDEYAVVTKVVEVEMENTEVKIENKNTISDVSTS